MAFDGVHEHPVDPERVAAARETALTKEASEEVARTLRLLADPVRARVASALAAGEEMCVGDIALRSTRGRTRSPTRSGSSVQGASCATAAPGASSTTVWRTRACAISSISPCASADGDARLKPPEDSRSCQSVFPFSRSTRSRRSSTRKAPTVPASEATTTSPKRKPASMARRPPTLPGTGSA